MRLEVLYSTDVLAFYNIVQRFKDLNCQLGLIYARIRNELESDLSVSTKESDAKKINNEASSADINNDVTSKLSHSMHTDDQIEIENEHSDNPTSDDRKKNNNNVSTNVFYDMFIERVESTEEKFDGIYWLVST